MAKLSFILLSALTLFAIEVPPLSGRIVDEARLFTSAESMGLTSQLEALESKAGVQAAVLTVKSLEGEDIEGFSLRVAEHWKLGKKGADKGLLLVIAQKDRRMRFEVGYGLEGDITDAFSKRLIVENLAPYFRINRYADGVAASFTRIAEKLGVEGVSETPQFETVMPENTPLVKFFMEYGFLLVLIPILVLNAIFSGGRRRGRRYYSGGSGYGGGGWSGGGGGFSGGGGSFGGGGSSGSW